MKKTLKAKFSGALHTWQSMLYFGNAFGLSCCLIPIYGARAPKFTDAVWSDALYMLGYAYGFGLLFVCLLHYIFWPEFWGTQPGSRKATFLNRWNYMRNFATGKQRIWVVLGDTLLFLFVLFLSIGKDVYNPIYTLWEYMHFRRPISQPNMSLDEVFGLGNVPWIQIPFLWMLVFFILSEIAYAKAAYKASEILKQYYRPKAIA